MSSDVNIDVADSKPTQYKYYTFLVALLITLALVVDTMGFKLVKVGSVFISAASMFVAFKFILVDIIVEVYGYRYSRPLVWYIVICTSIYALLTIFIVHLPSPSFWHYQNAFVFVFTPAFRITLAANLGIICGLFANIYILSKWKILLRGKYFWLRSFCASFFGEIILVLFITVIGFATTMTLAELGEVVFISLLVKWFMNIILIIFAAPAVNFLKKKEGVDIYDQDINYNPFKLRV